MFFTGKQKGDHYETKNFGIGADAGDASALSGGGSSRSYLRQLRKNCPMVL